MTEVIDACHFWAHVGGKLVIERMEAINKELLSQVNYEALVKILDKFCKTFEQQVQKLISKKKNNSTVAFKIIFETSHFNLFL